MSYETLIFIILSGIAALIIALFQYIYKSNFSHLRVIFTLLRFVSLFSVLLLIINPTFEKESIINIKPNLVIAIDNSESIHHLNKDKNVLKLLNDINNSQELEEKFNLNYYEFGAELNTINIDSLTFLNPQTNISKVFSDLNQIYTTTISPTILITDGNQTFGYDYEYDVKSYEQSIYPIILGDTTTYADLKIEQLNVNKYAYLKNKFPVEIIATYSGDKSINTRLIINSGNKTIYDQSLSFSKTTNSKTINITLLANKVGLNTYNASLKILENEKNITNNLKSFVVETINQKTKIAIITDMVHPDIGMLKKSIETNDQRSVSILSPDAFLNIKDNFQFAILYQPSTKFREVLSSIEKDRMNSFIITGTKTQWSFLNQVQDKFLLDISKQFEQYQAQLNTSFSSFFIEDLEFNTYPPLNSEFGDIAVSSPFETLFFKKINSLTTKKPLLISLEDQDQRQLLLLGENIWKWRIQSYLNKESFEAFDNFIGKMVQYLAINKKRNRINLDYESYYSGNGSIIFSLQFFDKNYEFDSKADININVINKETKKTTIIPFLIKNNTYQADLSGFSSGEYDFKVMVNKGELARSGTFIILPYNVEKQFLNANVTKLEKLAIFSNGKSYFIENTDSLISDLLMDIRYKTVQKSMKNIVPLIDFKFLLALMILSLSSEWFLRKYHGLI